LHMISNKYLPLIFNEINISPKTLRLYEPFLTASVNRKGVLDVDSVKGCYYGMKTYPNGGCYGECYAAKIANLYGFDFTVSVSRKFLRYFKNGFRHLDTINKILQRNTLPWYRIGTCGDPCHDWDNTLTICESLSPMKKIPVIVTKHWIAPSDDHISRLKKLKAVINTSTSGMDSDDEIKYRIEINDKLKSCGVNAVCRIVTCNYGKTKWGKQCKDKQDFLITQRPIIDTPFRVRNCNPHVIDGDILIETHNESIGGGKLVSLHNSKIYLGKCKNCPDQCGVDPVDSINLSSGENMTEQIDLFPSVKEFRYLKSVIGSGYEERVSQLALEDGIAHRAARKNMQIHSAIILIIEKEFVGFFTFQNNDECKEFCLLQSVIRPDKYTEDLYKQMVCKVIDQNINNYPAIITTDPRSKFETPKLFESLGFQTYLKMSGFCYMVRGELSGVRMKLLAHITMTNVWDSTKGTWPKLKKEWNQLIDELGVKYEIENPSYATRDGCWQGESGFANVVTGHSHNGNASVLDPVACEVVLRFFIPKNGRRVYNPFGGGVQFGIISGSSGYQYIASEIRKNQCDANNKLCSHFQCVKWIQSDSSTYDPDGMFDLVFTCPPYYKVETYLDYDGQPPHGEINSMSTYEEFKKTLFSGYKKAAEHLNDNCFFVVMTGDSRDKNGAYYCSESETELFLKSLGLSIYNKIVYLEPEFTRLAQAKKTLNYRKFPKREQKIIVAYKGKIDAIKELYQPLGRL
jgi:hypothetical protein